MDPVQLLDLTFLGLPQAIASFLIPHEHGIMLIESGPATTFSTLKNEIGKLGYSLAEVTDLFVTHIHLDHAGAAGWVAQESGARIHAHPRGAPHLANPVRLISSATRIYGDDMDRLWGEVLPVPEERLNILEEGQEVEIGGARIRVLETRGHANHHHVYLYDGICFTGDVGGVRLPGPLHLELPFPPPEIDLEAWRLSLEKISAQDLRALATTHFGIHMDVGWHLQTLSRQLERAEAWFAQRMQANPNLEELRPQVVEWYDERRRRHGLEEPSMLAIEAANPARMSADGLWRYWQQRHQP